MACPKPIPAPTEGCQCCAVQLRDCCLVPALARLRRVDCPHCGVAHLTFTRIETADLRGTGAAAPLCLDDQWFPTSDLYSKGLLRRSATSELAATEFKRAILSSSRLVVNRSYLANSDALSLLWGRGADRAGLKQLLHSGDIIAFLHDDASPRMELAQKQGTVPIEQMKHWSGVLEDTHVTCARLSWESDAANLDAIRVRITDRFTRRLTMFGITGANVLASLVPKSNDVGESARYLREVFCPTLDDIASEGVVRRSDIYKRLIIVNGSDLSNTMIDTYKPFAREIKQIVDLIYNTTLSDATSIEPITPTDSPSRSVLSESGDIAAIVSVEEAAALLVRVHEALKTQKILDRYIGLFDVLTVQDIRAIRLTAEWNQHISTAAQLAQNPTSSGRVLVDEMQERVAAFNRDAEALGKVIVTNFLNGWSGSSRPLAKVYQRGMKVLIGQATKLAVSGAGALAFAAGIDTAIVAGSALAGLVADEALDELKEKALGKARQQIDVAIGHAMPLVMNRLPRLELADPSATGAEVALFIEQHYRRSAKEIFSDSADTAAKGHCSSIDMPAYD